MIQEDADHGGDQGGDADRQAGGGDGGETRTATEIDAGNGGRVWQAANVTGDGTSALAAVARETTIAIADRDTAGLIDRILDLKVGYGMIRYDAIARRLNEHEEADAQIPVEVVRDLMHSPQFKRAQDIALSDPEGWSRKRFRAVQRVTRHRMEVEHLASRANADKRTRTANLHFALGLAGFTPQTQVAVGPNEDFLKLVEKALARRNGDADAPR